MSYSGCSAIACELPSLDSRATLRMDVGFSIVVPSKRPLLKFFNRIHVLVAHLI